VKKKKAAILVTNDDGVGAPGIKALAAALRALGNVWVVAPDRPQSAVGRAMTLHKPLRLIQHGKQTFAVNGTPSDCINLGLGKLLQTQLPVLIVSGINKGLNLGDDVTNSGTVSGAMEGLLHGIPSIAVSQDDQEPCRYQIAADYTLDLAKMVLKHGLPGDTFLNVNIPNCSPHQIQGVKFTSLSRRQYKNPVIEKVDPRGFYYYWIAGERISLQRQKPSDFEAVSKRMVSITPLHLDMTQYQALKTLRAWESVLNSGEKVLARKGSPGAKSKGTATKK
jgi:5'-nucleotidase